MADESARLESAQLAPHPRSCRSSSEKRTSAVNALECLEKPVSERFESLRTGQSPAAAQALRRQPERLGHGPHPGSLQCLQRVVDHHLPAAKVAQREPVARRFGARTQALHLAEVPVQPLVEIDEPNDVAPGAEPDLF